MAAGAAELTLVPEPGQIRLDISGELDLSTAEQLGELLRWLEQTGRGAHLDLSAVSFIDSSGLTPVLDSAQRRQEAGLPPLVLIAASRQVHRLLGLLGGDPGVRALVSSQVP